MTKRKQESYKGKRLRSRTTRERIECGACCVAALADIFLIGLGVHACTSKQPVVEEQETPIQVSTMVNDWCWGAGYTGSNVPVAQDVEWCYISEEAENREAQPPVVLDYWADCRVTAYCPCEKCCGKWARNRPKDANGKPIVTGASGVRLESYVTCASSLPFGTKLYIPELDLHTVVQDRAAKSIHNKYGGHYVDIYIDDHAECYSYLSGHNDYMEVYIEK